MQQVHDHVLRKLLCNSEKLSTTSNTNDNFTLMWKNKQYSVTSFSVTTIPAFFDLTKGHKSY